jgi:glycosyltransferase involved in cell wall biosynthesis
MKIGIDISTWHNGRGFGRFTREVITALLKLPTSHEFILFGDSPGRLDIAPDRADQITVQTKALVTESAVSDGNRSVGDVLAFTRAVARQKPDVLFYPAVYSWFPAPPGMPVVLTLHDAIAEHFPELVFPQWRNRFFWNLKMRLARWQATRFLTVSNAAREEIHTHLGIDLDRIDLTTEGPKDAFQPPEDEQDRESQRSEIIRRYELPEDGQLFTYVGGFAPHKNLLGLLDSLDTLKAGDRYRNVRLFMVGDYSGHGFHSNYEELRARIDASERLRDAVVFTGFIEDEELASIYRASVAMVLPSFSEGFGLPAVEAMACGTPVLASNRASLPEVVGSGGILFDPGDRDEMARAMEQVLASEQELTTLRQRALAQAGHFTWEAAARGVLTSIERCRGA